MPDRSHAAIILAIVIGLTPSAPVVAATTPPADEGYLSFDDTPLEQPLSHPDWFKLSFLDLPEDLREAAAAEKRLLLYFGQKYCAYCKALLEGNWGKSDIRTYTRAHFDVIGIDIHGDQPVTDLRGQEWSEREFSAWEDIDFTPSLLFLGRDGSEILRLRGYYPPYKFRAALEYVADNHFKNESFRDYLARADASMVFEAGGMNHQDFFLRGPLALDRSRFPGERPLVVFFEQGDCHACDVLHNGPLRDAEIRTRMQKLETVQLSLWGKSPVITPAGKRTTAREWAAELGLFYAPTLIFFDEHGKEIIRVDSVVQFYRLRNVLDFVLTGAYRTQPNFQRWRETAGDEHERGE